MHITKYEFQKGLELVGHSGFMLVASCIHCCLAMYASCSSKVKGLGGFREQALRRANIHIIPILRRIHLIKFLI